MQSETLPQPVHMVVFTNGAQALEGEALRYPGKKAMIAAPRPRRPARGLRGLTCATLDIDAKCHTPTRCWKSYCVHAQPARRALLRAGKRYGQVLRPAPLPDAVPEMPDGAHWIITGGFWRYWPKPCRRPDYAVQGEDHPDRPHPPARPRRLGRVAGQPWPRGYDDPPHSGGRNGWKPLAVRSMSRARMFATLTKCAIRWPPPKLRMVRLTG